MTLEEQLKEAESRDNNKNSKILSNESLKARSKIDIINEFSVKEKCKDSLKFKKRHRNIGFFQKKVKSSFNK